MTELSPATLEGWYVLHQAFRLDWAALRRLPPAERAELAEEARTLLLDWADLGEGGWSAAFDLVGGGADLLLVHFRAGLAELGEVERRLRASRLGELLRLEYDFLSVTEVGLYHATAEAAAQEEPGSEAFQRALAERVAQEAASPYLKTRLYPRAPEGMDFVSFYPMSKRRSHPDNWYALPIEERNRLMRDHGLTGRRFAGRVFQVISGAVGLDDWEWGVTLFSRDPLEFKRIVTDMRFDEVSARYGEFGRFFTGIRLHADALRARLSGA